MYSLSKRNKRNLLGCIIVLYIIVESFGPTLPWIEGKLFPVIENFEIQVDNRWEAPMSEWTWISGTFDKVRNCDMDRLDWYRGDPKGQNVRVEVHFTRFPIMGVDHHTFSDIKLSIPVQEINNSFAFVYHSCHPFYLTKTVIYP